MKKDNLVAGIWSGHDSSFAVLTEDGHPIIHAEHERYSRIKESRTDALKFLFDEFSEHDKIKYFVSVYPSIKTKEHQESYQKALEICKKNGGSFHFYPHHLSHAASVFFSSNLEKSTIITIDGGGMEDERTDTACAIWWGDGKEIRLLKRYLPHELNIGGCWSRYVRYIFSLPNSSPQGGAHGTIMSHASYGDPSRFKEDFLHMMTKDILMSSVKPAGQKDPFVKGQDPVHPYLDKWKKIADQSEQDMLDLAAGLQAATEEIFKGVVAHALRLSPSEDALCFSGGVALNSVCTGKVWDWFPQVKNIHINNCVHDGGLTIGAAQYHCHSVLGRPRIQWDKNFSPYMGYEISDKEVFDTLQAYSEKVSWAESSDEELVELLMQGKVISTCNGRAESGKRALGSRSILGDPRNPKMKEIINKKIKNRDNRRPFAPSILKEEVVNWFERDIESPYMSFVLQFKEEQKEKVPAVVHADGTGRLQTVCEEDHKWYYSFLKLWHEKSGVPIILNTSLNNSTPVCNNPKDTLDCFLSCDMDHVYFADQKVLVSKK